MAPTGSKGSKCTTKVAHPLSLGNVKPRSIAFLARWLHLKPLFTQLVRAKETEKQYYIVVIFVSFFNNM